MLNRLFATRKNPYVPGADTPEKLEIDFSGSVLSLELPPHSDYEGFQAKPVPTHINIYDNDQYEDEEGLPEWQKEGASYYHILKRSIEFRGPFWRGRPFGTIRLSIGITRHDALPEGMSCFNPAHFEQVAIRKLYHRGPFDLGYHPKKGPMNWRLIPQTCGHTGIYFETHWDFSTEPAQMEYQKAMHDCILMLPLENQHSLCIYFIYYGYAPANDSINAMSHIREEILKTIQLRLSETSKNQLAQIQKQSPNAKASIKREPENWMYPEWRDGNEGEDHIVITKAGTPMPEFTL